jgi:hypothetical protein
MPGARVERIESPSGRKEDPLLATVRPPRDSAIDVRLACAVREGIEAPDEPAAVGPERQDGERGSCRVEDAIDDDGRRLDLGTSALRSVAGVIRPREPELRDVTAVDLVERGVSCVAGLSTRNTPIASRRVVR